MKLAKQILLSPFSIIYGTIVYLRNKFYDWGIFKFHEFKTATISIGNLSVGGTGKTPHTEYLIKLLNDFKIVTLSRGYKRKTSGFIVAKENHTSSDIGDEPLQYFNKFKSIKVVVDEKRVNGIKNIEKLFSDINAILLDDAFQHRAVKPGKSILITEYNDLYNNDFLLPSGKLREWRCGAKRADIIIVSKCPENISNDEQVNIIKTLKPSRHQNVKFSFIKYEPPKAFFETEKTTTTPETSVIVFTGIGNPKPFIIKVKEMFNEVEHIQFPDHHQYTVNDISKIKSCYTNTKADNKVIITTEKDIMRLYLPELKNEFKDIPVFYIPITIDFLGNGKEEFDKEILDYVRANS